MGQRVAVLQRVEYDHIDPAHPLYLFVRNLDRTRSVKKVIGFEPYFFVRSEYRTTIELTGYKRILDTPIKTLWGSPLIKVETNLVSDVRLIREYLKNKGVFTYEADIPFTKRFQIDSLIMGGLDLDTLQPTDTYVEPRILYVDIEVLAAKADQQYRDPICTIGWSDSYTGDWGTLIWHPAFYTEDPHTQVFSSEKDLLEAFANLVSNLDPDILTAWYAYFDLGYIYNRMRKLRMQPNRLSPMPTGTFYVKDRSIRIKGRSVIDLLQAYRKFNPKMVSYKLDNVAREELMAKKAYLPDSVNKVWQTNPSLLVKYNHTDVDLLVQLESKLKLIDYFDRLRVAAGIPIEDAFWAALMDDALLLRESRKRNWALPNKKEYKGEVKAYEGARISDPHIGIHSNVALMDIKSLYPTIILKWNVSPELMGNRLHKKGFFPELIEALIGERKALKNEIAMRYDRTKDILQDCKKIQANALYGFLGDPKSRVYVKALAAKVTEMGRRIHHDMEACLVNINKEVIYGDTDSIFFKLSPGDRVESILNRVERDLNALYPGNPPIGIELKCVYTGLILLSKKRYAGVFTNSSGKREWDWKGLEARRTDTSEITKWVQESVIKAILAGATEETIREFLQEVKDKFLSGQFTPTQVGIPTAIRKRLQDYGDDAIQKKAAKAANELLGSKWDLGDKPYRVYLKDYHVGDRKYEVIAIDEDTRLPSDAQIDYDKMLRVTIAKKMKPILGEIMPGILDLFPKPVRRVGSRRLKPSLKDESLLTVQPKGKDSSIGG